MLFKIPSSHIHDDALVLSQRSIAGTVRDWVVAAPAVVAVVQAPPKSDIQRSHLNMLAVVGRVGKCCDHCGRDWDQDRRVYVHNRQRWVGPWDRSRRIGGFGRREIGFGGGPIVHLGWVLRIF